MIIFSKDYMVQEIFDPELYTKRDKRTIISYPKELKDYKILQDNFSKMGKITKEYKIILDRLQQNTELSKNLIWDSQKNSIQMGIEKDISELEKLEQEMNEGISPYRWNIFCDLKVLAYDDDINYIAFNVPNIIFILTRK